MLNQPTLEKLHAMKLHGMAEAFRAHLETIDTGQLSFEERFALLVDQQWLWKENRALARRLRTAKLKERGTREDIDYQHPRGLDRKLMRTLATSEWVKQHQNVILIGPTGGSAALLVERVRHPERMNQRLCKCDFVIFCGSIVATVTSVTAGTGRAALAIARQLRMHRRLVRQYLRAGVLPRTPPSGRQRQLDPYARYLSQRWQEGCHNAAPLWREWRERGFSGSDTRVRQWMRQYHRPDKNRITAVPAVAPLVPSPRQITWILLDGPRPADEKTKAWIEEFRQRVPEIDRVTQLAHQFVVLLREKRSNQLSDWLAQAAQSPLASFAAGLRRDLAAVKAACSSPWSQGQVEGQVNRLKLLKRQMYGRAGFPLLRSRVLAAPSPGSRTQVAAA